MLGCWLADGRPEINDVRSITAVSHLMRLWIPAFPGFVGEYMHSPCMPPPGDFYAYIYNIYKYI